MKRFWTLAHSVTEQRFNYLLCKNGYAYLSPGPGPLEWEACAAKRCFSNYLLKEAEITTGVSLFHGGYVLRTYWDDLSSCSRKDLGSRLNSSLAVNEESIDQSAEKDTLNKISQVGESEKQAKKSGKKAFANQLCKIHRDQYSAVIPEIGKWLEEGKELEREHLFNSILKFRNIGRYKHALEVSNYMFQNKSFPANEKDIILRLDLIAKVQGLTAAKEFFNQFPPASLSQRVHDTFFSHIVKSRSVAKAEAQMKQMEQLGMVCDSSPFNRLLELYKHTGLLDKAPLLIEEMKRRGIKPTSWTYNIYLDLLGNASDLNGMEKLYNDLKAEEPPLIDASTYGTLANAYIKMGMKDKALSALKDMEISANSKTAKIFTCLITFYAKLGKTEEVERVWALKHLFSPRLNFSHMAMIDSLCKLGEIEKAEKLFWEWDAIKKLFDIRVVNVLFKGYYSKGLMDKAKTLLEYIQAKEKQLSASTFQFLVQCYVDIGEETKVTGLVKNFSASGDFKFNLATVLIILGVYAKNGDVEAAEDFIQQMKLWNCNAVEKYNMLLHAYDKAGRTVAALAMLERMERDNVVPNDETYALLRKVDPGFS